MVAAPRPWAARAATSSQSVGAMPHSSEASVNRQIAQPADADDQRRDDEQIGEHDPLHRLEIGGERPRQGRQAGIGDAGVERRHQHGE